MNDREAVLETIIACLVARVCECESYYNQACDEVRIPNLELEEPPDIDADDDPVTGDWIFRLVSGE